MQSRTLAEAKLDIHHIENMDTLPLSVTNASTSPSVSGAYCVIRVSPLLEVERSALWY